MDHAKQHWEIIRKNYDRIKDSVNRESLRTWAIPVDEDILHDTIIKCVDVTRKRKMTERQMMGYVFASYKTNIMREAIYARNRLKAEGGLEPAMGIASGEASPESTADYNILIERVEDRFGSEDMESFENVLEGDRISDLEKEKSDTGLRYRMQKIRTDLIGILKMDGWRS